MIFWSPYDWSLWRLNPVRTEHPARECIAISQSPILHMNSERAIFQTSARHRYLEMASICSEGKESWYSLNSILENKWMCTSCDKRTGGTCKRNAPLMYYLTNQRYRTPSQTQCEEIQRRGWNMSNFLGFAKKRILECGNLGCVAMQYFLCTQAAKLQYKTFFNNFVLWKQYDFMDQLKMNLWLSNDKKSFSLSIVRTKKQFWSPVHKVEEEFF